MTQGRRPALKKARERAGLTQRALAERIGISRAFVISVEVGRRNPKLGIMERWAKALESEDEYSSLDMFRIEPEDDDAGQQLKANLPEVA